MTTLFPLLLGALVLSTAGAAHPQTYAVQIQGFAFKPSVLTIAPGDSVEFVNDDADAHTVTASDKSFDSAGLDTKDTWKHTFAKAGSYAYYCALHPYMKGKIVVQAANEPSTAAIVRPALNATLNSGAARKATRPPSFDRLRMTLDQVAMTSGKRETTSGEIGVTSPVSVILSLSKDGLTDHLRSASAARGRVFE